MVSIMEELRTIICMQARCKTPVKDSLLPFYMTIGTTHTKRKEREREKKKGSEKSHTK